jgi:hypothetical protein
MSSQLSFWDTPSAISLPESEDGQSRFALRGGLMIVRCGRVVALVNLSPRQAKDLGVMTHVTSGLRGSGSSSSVALSESTASRLQMQLPTAGGMMWPQIWKRRATPAGRQYCQLAVSAGRTKEIGCGLWQTAQARDWKNGQASRYPNRSNLNDQALWMTPSCLNIAERSEESAKRRKEWRLSLGRNTVPPGSLAEQVSMWPTPNCRDWKDTGDMSNSMVRKDGKSWMDTLGRLTFNGSTAQTESKGSLNPAFVCWLMGYPEGYEKLLYTAMETQSSQKSQQSSSLQQPTKEKE